MRDGFSVPVTHCLGCGHGQAASVGPEGEGFTVCVEGREFHQPPYAIRECSKCGLIYRTPILSDAQFADYYSRKNFRGWEVAGLYPTEKAALAVLHSLSLGAKILDFGCSSGRLLAELGGGYDRYGFEINQEASAVAASKGLKMLAPNFFTENRELKFDAIILVDVFEHLTSPTSLLGQLTASLKPGGILIIVTGDGDNRVCRRNPAEFWYFKIIEHVGMITRRYADWLTGELPLELKTWRRVRHYDWEWPSTLMQWARQFTYWQFRSGSRPMRTLLRMIPHVRNAEKRTIPPIWQYSADHIVAVFANIRKT